MEKDVRKPDRSVKYNYEGDMIYEEVKHRFSNAEDEMIENILVKLQTTSKTIRT